MERDVEYHTEGDTVVVRCAGCGREFEIPRWQFEEDVDMEGKDAEFYCEACDMPLPLEAYLEETMAADVQPGPAIEDVHWWARYRYLIASCQSFVDRWRYQGLLGETSAMAELLMFLEVPAAEITRLHDAAAGFASGQCPGKDQQRCVRSCNACMTWAEDYLNRERSQS